MSLAFVDYEKAFDPVETNAILGALTSQGINPQYVKLIGNIYSAATSTIQLHAEGSPFTLKRGVRQGDSMSPKPFISCLQTIFDKLQWNDKQFGLQIGNEYLNNLRFADDIVLIAKNPQELQTMVNQLYSESHRIGLKMNKAKTKTMSSNIAQAPKIEVENEELGTVQHYIYLGRMIQNNGSQEKELQRCVTMAWSKRSSYSQWEPVMTRVEAW